MDSDTIDDVLDEAMDVSGERLPAVDTAMTSSDEDESEVQADEAAMDSELISYSCKVCDFEDDVKDMVIEHLRNHTEEEKVAVKKGAQMKKVEESTGKPNWIPGYGPPKTI